VRSMNGSPGSEGYRGDEIPCYAPTPAKCLVGSQRAGCRDIKAYLPEGSMMLATASLRVPEMPKRGLKQ
jgi:hypothetical protein